MFDNLTAKFEATLKKITNRGKLSERDLEESLKEIRVALLEADVNFQVVKKFCDNVKDKAIGAKVHKNLNPSQQVIAIVHDELIETIGEPAALNFRFAPPVVIMLVGLQGSGKTTTCGKLAKYLKEDLKRRPVMVSVDVYRPAAIAQLKKLGESLGVEVIDSNNSEKPIDIAKRAEEYAKKVGFDTLIIDTAGRLQIDEELMDELAEIIQEVNPHEVLLVADAMVGQESVNIAKGFDERLDIDGLILTKLDGDARGGAALSMRAVTGKPIKFIGLGEKLDALEIFHPDRMASRILGMGDILSLIEKTTKNVNLEDAKALTKKIKKNEFTLEDFHSQLKTIKNMGSMTSMMQMIPGLGKAARSVDDEVVNKEFKKIEAIIQSMTIKERQDYTIIDGSRRRRIAKGSGTTVEDINRLLKQFVDMSKMMKKFMKMGPNSFRGLTGMLKGQGFNPNAGS